MYNNVKLTLRLRPPILGYPSKGRKILRLVPRRQKLINERKIKRIFQRVETYLFNKDDQ